MDGVVVAVSRSAKHTMSKPNEDSVRLLAGLGVEGDAHLGETVKHRSRVARDPAQPNLRQVHLIHAELHDELPKTWGSPTMSPHCSDEAKYAIVAEITAQYKVAAAAGALVAGQKVRELVTVNGVRVVLEDGTWGLVRASSNKPELVIVVESPASEANMRAIFADIDQRLSQYEQVGAYNQKI